MTSAPPNLNSLVEKMLQIQQDTLLCSHCCRFPVSECPMGSHQSAVQQNPFHFSSIHLPHIRLIWWSEFHNVVIWGMFSPECFVLIHESRHHRRMLPCLWDLHHWIEGKELINSIFGQCDEISKMWCSHELMFDKSQAGVFWYNQMLELFQCWLGQPELNVTLA